MRIFHVIGDAGCGKDTIVNMLAEIYTQWGERVESAAFAAPFKSFCQNIFEFPTMNTMYGSSASRQEPLLGYQDSLSQDKVFARARQLGPDFYQDCRESYERYDLRFNTFQDPGPARFVAAMEQALMGLFAEPVLSGRRILQMIGHDVGRNVIGPDVWICRMLSKIDYFQENTSVFFISDTRYENEFSRVDEHVQGRDSVALRITSPGAALDGLAAKHASADQSWVDRLPTVKKYGIFNPMKGLPDLRAHLEFSAETIRFY